MTEAIDFYQKIRTQLKEQKPFVAYRKPGKKAGRVDAILQNTSESFAVKDLKESGFVFAAFNPEQPAWYIPIELSDKYVLEKSAEHEIDSELYEYLSSGTDFEYMEEDQKLHERLVQKGIDRIMAGDFKKVVLARSEKVAVHDPDPIRIFRKLLNKYAQAFVYIWFHPETGCWLGATPETLLKAERDRFTTMALAGTQLYKEGVDAEWDKKEVEEQAFVTEYILDSLSEIGISAIDVLEPYSAKAGNLLHIRTDISGRLNGEKQLGELIKVLHPTPAVCGLPKQKALQFILENEKASREFYSGYLGELNMKTETKRSSNRRNQENQQFASISTKTELYVNLRCMKLKDGNARIFVGGGITKDSNAADEWMETVNKSQTMKAVLVK